MWTDRIWSVECNYQAATSHVWIKRDGRVLVWAYEATCAKRWVDRALVEVWTWIAKRWPEIHPDRRRKIAAMLVYHCGNCPPF